MLFFVLSLLGNLTYGAGVSLSLLDKLTLVTNHIHSDHRSLHRERIYYKKLALADRVFGHYGGRYHHFHTIPHLRPTCFGLVIDSMLQYPIVQRK